jgi:hypothetical protein
MPNAFERTIIIIGSDDERLPAKLSCCSRDCTESGVRQVECSIQLIALGFNISDVGSDFFEAFCGIRDQLATHDFIRSAMVPVLMFFLHQ